MRNRMISLTSNIVVLDSYMIYLILYGHSNNEWKKTRVNRKVALQKDIEISMYGMCKQQKRFNIWFQKEYLC